MLLQIPGREPARGYYESQFSAAAQVAQCSAIFLCYLGGQLTKYDSAHHRLNNKENKNKLRKECWIEVTRMIWFVWENTLFSRHIEGARRTKPLLSSPPVNLFWGEQIPLFLFTCLIWTCHSEGRAGVNTDLDFDTQHQICDKIWQTIVVEMHGDLAQTRPF